MFDASPTQGDLLCSDAAPATEESTSHPESITILEQAFFEELDLRAEITEKVRALGAKIKSACSSGRDTGIDVEPTYDMLDRYLERVEEVARVTFSTQLAPFNVERAWTRDVISEARDALHLDRYSGDRDPSQALRAASPKALWRAIAKNYDPAAQEKAQIRKDAEVLARKMGLLNRSYTESGPRSFKIVKGLVEIPITVYTEKRWYERRVMEGDVRTLAEFGHALAGALARTGDGSAASVGHEFASTIQSYAWGHREVVSRERIPLGFSCELVTMFREFKLYVSQDIAARINLFIAESGVLESS